MVYKRLKKQLRANPPLFRATVMLAAKREKKIRFVLYDLFFDHLKVE